MRSDDRQQSVESQEVGPLSALHVLDPAPALRAGRSGLSPDTNDEGESLCLCFLFLPLPRSYTIGTLADSSLFSHVGLCWQGSPFPDPLGTYGESPDDYLIHL